MNAEQLLRKLLLRAPPDLLADIYGKARFRKKEVGHHEVAWGMIVDRARMLGIFSAEEGERFLNFVADHFPKIVDVEALE
jgi:hypothetical protein